MTNKTGCLLLLLLSFFSVAVAQKAGTDLEKEVELTTEKGVLKGTLLVPASKQPFPLVLLISGSGPTDRNGNNPMATNNSLKMVAEGLQAQGIACLRYDKRGVGESKSAMISEQDLRFDDYVQDAAQWLQKMKTDKRFSKVVVLGHSEGSLIGMIAAQRAAADGFISIAGAGEPAGAVIRKQLQAQPPAVADMAIPILDRIIAGETVTDSPPMLAALFRPSVQPYLQSWFQYNPRAELKKLMVPVLVVQGHQDLQVSKEDASKLVTANPKALLVELGDMNHVLKTVSGDRNENLASYSKADLPLAPSLLPAIEAFVKRIK